MTRRNAYTLVAMATLWSCSSQPQATTRPTRAHPDVITHEQIAKGGFTNAYDAVEALHPNWFQVRNVTPSYGTGNERPAARPTGAGAVVVQPKPGEESRAQPGTNAGIQVYVDAVRVGGVEELRRISTIGIASLRHYNGTDAQQRFGIGHSNGVIAVVTSRDKPPE